MLDALLKWNFNFDNARQSSLKENTFWKGRHVPGSDFKEEISIKIFRGMKNQWKARKSIKWHPQPKNHFELG